ncbi:KTSC domain-containing protein [Paraburkholderia sp. SARCC-3016]|uniref:KTSC domain-containing protein n=1 Tax=Paraburkholderia sp. SARCC-3016 TaxID=3058611 RepID=UPI002807DD37|nr:KTSC domain-containing protein [Paraburkholderia sp. SARCC-3016]MDQ7981917.1 KTSC domain-containing protein [Paraburkholderia sp. SARCC-3016]
MDALHIQALITMTEVQSSQIHSIGHHTPTLTLAIRFKNKKGPAGLYHYANVTAETFGEFRNAASIGAYFGAKIKARLEYPCTRIVEPAENVADSAV